MSLDTARDHLFRLGLADHIRVVEESSATVADAAAALGTEPERIAKTLSFRDGDGALLVVAAGDARVSNTKFRGRFGTKPRMLPAADVESLVGHAVGGVCPFAVPGGVPVYLDASLSRFDVVYPACGSANSAVELTLAELERAAAPAGWVDVTDVPGPAGP